MTRDIWQLLETLATVLAQSGPVVQLLVVWLVCHLLFQAATVCLWSGYWLGNRVRETARFRHVAAEKRVPDASPCGGPGAYEAPRTAWGEEAAPDGGPLPARPAALPPGAGTWGAYGLERSLAEGDLSSVYRVVQGHAAYVMKLPRAAAGNELAAKEWRVLEQLHAAGAGRSYGHFLPWLHESCPAAEGRNRANLFAWRDGFYTAEQILGRHPRGLDGRHLAWMFKRVLELLGFVHRQGWLHGAVLPPHLMYHAADHSLQLVGWIHAEPCGSILRLAPRRYRDWYPPECRVARPATPAVDIYLAARSMVYLGGGEPLSGRLPRTVPRRLRRFLASCLHESPARRPQDAWQVHDAFTELLEVEFGPPAYHALTMAS